MTSPDVTIQAVLFDATGTLIEPARTIGETYAEAARAQGVTLPAWRIQDAFERVLARAEPRVFPGLHDLKAIAAAERDWWLDLVRQTFQAVDSTLRFADSAALATGLFDHYADASAWRLRTGARTALADLTHGGLRAGVVSNFDLRLSGILQGLGIIDALSCVVLPAHCGARKPDRRIFEAALAALELPAGCVAMVGDDPEQDLAGARAAGLWTLDIRGWSSLAELPRRLRDPANLAR